MKSRVAASHVSYSFSRYSSVSRPAASRTRCGLPVAALSILAMAMASSPSALAGPKYWDTTSAAGLLSGTGVWDTASTSLWSTATAGTTLTTWSNTDDAFFQTTGANTVTISGTVIANSVTQATGGTATSISGGILQINTAAGIVNSGNQPLIIGSAASPTAVTLSNAANTTFTFNAGTTAGGAITINGAISESGGSASLSKIGTNTLTLTGTNTYTGTTTVGTGTLTLGGNSGGTQGSIANSSGITVSSANGGTAAGTLTLDYANGATTDKIKDTANVTLSLGGSLTVVSNSAANATETVGALGFDTGNSIVTLAAATGRTNTIAAGSLSRTNNGTALVRATNLGSGSASLKGLVTFGTAPSGSAFVGTSTTSGGAGTIKDLRIVPFLIGDTSSTGTPSGTGSSFLTYDSILGLRILVTNEYTPLATGYTTAANPENTKAGANVTMTNASGITVNSLLFDSGSGSTLNSTNANLLTVNSGALASVVNQTNAIGSGFSGISFGNGEGVVTVTQGSLAINTSVGVTSSGGLTKAGAGILTLGTGNTYSGKTVINQGTVQISAANNLGDSSATNTLALNGGILRSTANTYSLGTNRSVAVNGSSTIQADAGVLTIDGATTIGANNTLTTAGAGTIVFSGNLSNTSSSVAALAVTATGSGKTMLAPSGSNAVTLSTATPPITVGAGATLLLGGDGTAASATTSSNSILNTTSTGGVTFAVNATGAVKVNSGLWSISDFTANSSTNMNGAFQVSGGTLTTYGARYLAGGSTVTVDGGSLLFLNAGSLASSSNRFILGNIGALGTTATMNVSSGFVNIAKGSTTAQIGPDTSTTSLPNGLFNQSGGTVQIGVTGAQANAGLNIGGNSTTTSASAMNAAYTLTSGTLVVNGTIAGFRATGNAGSISNFNFMGGTLTAQAINASGFGSNSAATATSNQVAASNNIGTLVNYGGTLAPGGNIIASTTTNGTTTLTLTPTSGVTTITGNYSVSSGTLAVNIGGIAASTAFQDGTNSGKFSNLTVSGTTALAGTLTANLINGSGGTTFIPTTGNTFQVITSTGALSGTFSNAGGKVVLSNDPFSGSLSIGYTGSAVTLSGYAANEWLGAGGGGNWGSGSTGVWTNAVDPNAASSGAKFGAAGSANNSVTLDANRTVGQLLFSSANYTIGGSSTLTLDNGASAAVLTLQDANTQTISTPITLNSDLTVTGFSGGTVNLGALTGAAKNLTANTSGSTLTLTGNNTYNDTTIASGVVLNVGNGGTAGTLGSGSVTNSGSLVFNRSDTGLSVSSAINGAGNLTQAGSGVTTLTAANGYTGTTTISAGTLKLSGSGTLGATTSTLGAIASGAVLDLNGTNQTVAGFSGTSAGQIQNNSGSGTSVLTVGGSGANAFAGAIADNNTVATGGKVGLALNGTGAVTLSGNSTYSGETTVGGTSTLVIGGSSSISGGNVTSGVTGSGGVTFANGASLNNSINSNAWAVPTITLQGTLNLLGTNRLNLAFKTLDLTSGTRTININGKAIAVTGGNTLTSETTGNAQWEMQNVTTLGTSTVQNGTLDLQTTTFTGQTVGGGNGNYAPMRINNATSFSNADLVIGNNVLLMAANTGTLGNSASTSPNVTVDGILNLVASSQTGRTVSVKSLAGAGSIFGSMVASNTNNTTLALNGTSGSTNFSGLISNGPGTGSLALTKTGNSTQTLSGANTYSGNTTISGGTLLVNNTTGSGTGTGSVSVTGGATLGGTGSISGATSLASSTIGGSLSLGALSTSGSSTLASGGNVTVSGGTTIASGSFSVNGTLNSDVSVGTNTLNGTGTVNGTTTVNGGTVGGSLNLTTLVATGNSTIASSVTASSGTTVSSGVLTVSGTLNGGAVSIQNGATLKGAGTVNGATTIQFGGFLSPGNSPDLLTFGDTLVMAGTTTMELSGLGTDRGVNNANGFDAINVANQLTWGGTLDIVAIGGFNFDQVGSYNLFAFGSQTGGFASGAISVGGTALTAYDSITHVWSANNMANSFTYAFDLDNGTLAVTYTAIPEPSTFAALAGLGAIGLALYRRRRSVRRAA